MSSFDLFSQDYQAAAQQARKTAMDDLAVESQKLFPDYATPQISNTVTPQQVYYQHLLALRAHQKQTGPDIRPLTPQQQESVQAYMQKRRITSPGMFSTGSTFTDLTLRLNDLKGSIHLSRTGDQKLIEELHRLAAENRELKSQLALRAEPTMTTRLSASWEHLPDVIPINSPTPRSIPDFPFAALRRGNKQVVGLMTDRPM